MTENVAEVGSDRGKSVAGSLAGANRVGMELAEADVAAGRATETGFDEDAAVRP